MCILYLWSLHHLAIDHNMHIITRLATYSIDYCRVCVANIADRNARNKVVVTLTLRGVEIDSLGTLNRDKLWCWRGLSDMCQKLLAEYLILCFHKKSILLLL